MAVIACLVAVVVALGQLTAPEPALDEVLQRVAAYVAEFHKQLSGIVAEETYVQEIKNSPTGVVGGPFSTRKLKSDLLLVRPVGSDRYVEFRDVFEVDGHAVRDRQERLTKLFLDPPPGAASQLDRVIEESSRYNIGNVFRTLNTPVMPLAFLLEKYQPRFRFKRGPDTVGSQWVLEFEEKTRPTLVQTPRGLDMPSRGRFWIDARIGTVTKSELVVEDLDIKATIIVTYQSQTNLGFLVPAEMREAYVARRDRIEGRATYGRFRKFQVHVDEAIKPVKP